MDPPLSVEELVREFDEPNLIGWKLFSQSADLKVYRRLNQKLISYKVVIDMDYRFVWNEYLKDGKRISDENKQGIYWYWVT